MPSRTEVRKRRRDVLYGLLAAMAGSLVLGFVPGLTVMLGLHLVLDVLCVAYVAMLVRARNLAAAREMDERAAEREAKVRYLPPVGPQAPQPAFALRRSAN